ncbi:MAG: pyridoxal 5'-phosphate synthase glutaminase subunit PdxT [Spirochaetales bacterium]|nr:pyridoxal 5'-phosphate synthase glutaminase subunit PdxT [Spirochaetales bacterium]
MISPGILALQGGFEAHKKIVENLGYSPLLVKTKEDLDSSHCLIIPGGESTVITSLLERTGLLNPLKEKIEKGFPLFGTCAGMILLSSSVENSSQKTLRAMNYTVIRNAYGRQKESFETELTWENRNFSGLFIRAPKPEKVGSDVKILLQYEDNPILLREKNCLAASFHPELTGFDGIHSYFLNEMVDS